MCLWSPLITGGFCGADVPATLAWSSPVAIGDSNRRSGDCRGAVSDTHGRVRGRGSGPGAVCSARRNMKGRGGGAADVPVADAAVVAASPGAGGTGVER